MKIGRNETCWCGSGKKYKKCHLNREQLDQMQPWHIAADIRAEKAKKYCIHPLANSHSCSGNIVRAHTVPRRAALDQIARNGHVYSGDHDFMSLVKNGGKISFKEIGVREASTFTGFCGFHDDSTFAPLEKKLLTCTPEQCFLMGYRAVARELFLKRIQKDSVKILRQADAGRAQWEQLMVQQVAGQYEFGTDLGLQDIEFHKKQYDDILVQKSYDKYCYALVKISNAPDVLSSGAFFPEFDFKGGFLQNLRNQKLDLITFTLVPADWGGIAVLGWHQDSTTSCKQFASSLLSLPDDHIGNALARLAFEHIENTFLKPEWWESLGGILQANICDRLMVAASPDRPRISSCLCDDGVTYVHWPVIDKLMTLPQ